MLKCVPKFDIPSLNLKKGDVCYFQYENIDGSINYNAVDLRFESEKHLENY